MERKTIDPQPIIDKLAARCLTAKGVECSLLGEVIDMLRAAPKAAEVVHGEWDYRETRYGYRFICSECGMPWMMDARTHMCKKTDYCPNCGAKMDGDGNA